MQFFMVSNIVSEIISKYSLLFIEDNSYVRKETSSAEIAQINDIKFLNVNGN